MTRRITRREMIKASALAGAGVWLAAGPRAFARPPSERLNVAFVGIGGRGRNNLDTLGRQKDVGIVALCDVDDKRAGNAYEQYPQAKRFRDFRRMLDAVEKEIDAVVVSTPDHTHFHPSRAALQLGKHLYLEKPMAHSVWETRALTDLARKQKVATQLGVQRHTHDNIHRVVELVRSGAIGDVRECHAWVSSARGMPPIPTEFPPAPAHLDWDLWLGPAKARPYSRAYCPYDWRFWWDFGTGETGNWGCHIVDIPFWALELSHPTRVSGSGPEPHPQTSPKWMKTGLEFPARGSMPAVTLHWTQVDGVPTVLREHGIEHRGSGVLFVGSKGMLVCDFGNRKLYPEEKFKDFEAPKRSIPDSPGFHREWIDAAAGGAPATCNFDYSGPLTEAVLLGNVAYRSGEAFEWDAAALAPKGAPKAAELIRPPFRDGWTVDA